MDRLDVKAETSLTELIKFVILNSFIFALSIMVAGFNQYHLHQWLQVYTAVFLIVFALLKFYGYRMFVKIFPTYDMIAGRFKAYAKAYPFVMLLLGLMYLFGVGEPLRDYVLFLLGFATALSVLGLMVRNKKSDCACLGNMLKLPMCRVSLFEGSVMLVLALALLMS